MKNTFRFMAVMGLIILSVAPAFAGDRWTAWFTVSGGGVHDCGESKAQSETWNHCITKARSAEEATGIPISVANIEIAGYQRTDEEGPWYDHWHKCTFSAQSRCLLRS